MKVCRKCTKQPVEHRLIRILPYFGGHLSYPCFRRVIKTESRMSATQTGSRQDNTTTTPTTQQPNNPTTQQPNNPTTQQHNNSTKTTAQQPNNTTINNETTTTRHNNQQQPTKQPNNNQHNNETTTTTTT